MSAIRKGTNVTWKWGKSHAKGKVVEVHKEKITRKIKDAEVTRDGSDDNPALLIEQEDGDQVLKLASEVEVEKKS